MHRAVMVAGALALLASCQRSSATDPAQAYQRFARAAERNPHAAYQSLSTSTQKVLEAQSKEVSKLSGESIQDEPALIFFPGIGSTAPLGEVNLLQRTGDSATLSVKTEGGATREVKMVQEGGAWKVDLTHELSLAQARSKSP